MAFQRRFLPFFFGARFGGIWESCQKLVFANNSPVKTAQESKAIFAAA